MKDIASLVPIQSGLLQAAYHALKENGILVYSTCSLEPEEGEERVKAFLENNREAACVESELYFPREGGEDGGYIAKIRKGPDLQ